MSHSSTGALSRSLADWHGERRRRGDRRLHDGGGKGSQLGRAAYLSAYASISQVCWGLKSAFLWDVSGIEVKDDTPCLPDLSWCPAVLWLEVADARFSKSVNDHCQYFLCNAELVLRSLREFALSSKDASDSRPRVHQAICVDCSAPSPRLIPPPEELLEESRLLQDAILAGQSTKEDSGTPRHHARNPVRIRCRHMIALTAILLEYPVIYTETSATETSSYATRVCTNNLGGHDLVVIKILLSQNGLERLQLHSTLQEGCTTSEPLSVPVPIIAFSIPAALLSDITSLTDRLVSRYGDRFCSILGSEMDTSTLVSVVQSRVNLDRIVL